MPKIKILEKSVVNRIAAGEVIERPVSVVKELVENSIDAGAKNITLEFTDAGKKLIKVIDDGCGMDKEDLTRCLERHATSKIQNDADLFKIISFGFRGEALPSIASVSRLTIVSAVNNSGIGWSIKSDFGRRVHLKKASAAKGTVVIVEDLFSNVPVRKKFLKGNSYERRLIINIFEDFAFAHPDISFRLIENNKILANYQSASQYKDRFKDVLGKNVFENMIFFEFKKDNIPYSVKGLISKPDFTRNDRTRIKFFVNKRIVQNSELLYSVLRFYRDKIPDKKYPYAYILIDINPNLIDVNVHPTKKEIKFRESDKIFSFLNRAYGCALLNTDIHPIATYQKEIQKSEHSIFESLSIGSYKKNNLKLKKKYNSEDRKIEIIEKQKNFESLSLGFRIVGQIGRGYIIVEDEDGIEIIDQHAAHERVNYEKILEQYQRGIIQSQSLLIPEIIEFDKKDFETILNAKNLLNKIGFSIDVFGENTIKVESVPEVLRIKKVDVFFNNFIGCVNEFNYNRLLFDIGIIAKIACRSSVMEGDKLSGDELYSLVLELYKTKNRYTCPHGRPIIKRLTWKEIKKFFLRN